MSRTAESTGDFGAVSCVLDASRADEPVFVHDFGDREGEIDLVYPAGAVDSVDVVQTRNNAGGLVCVALPNDVLESLGLPFMDDVFDHPAASSYDLAYDSRSSSSFTVSCRDSFTGITGRDHATITFRFMPVAEAAHTGGYNVDNFGGEFRAPGYVYLLRGVSNLLSNRQGHTELGLALADEVGISPTVVVCEMLDDGIGVALPKDAARDYADRHGFVFVDDDGLIDELV